MQRSRWVRLLAVALAISASARAATITRGPFLQLASDTSVTVVFLTDAAGVGRVRYGTSAALLDHDAVEAAAGTSHAIRLGGLAAATRYYYAVEQDGAALAQGPGFTFRTYPPAGTPAPFRFFAWGDSGNGSSGQYLVANRMADELGEPAFALILGDIIYPSGEAQNYDPNFFRPYRDMLRRMVIWAAIGNHDVLTDGGAPYLDAFTLPANNPEGTELFYSFDYGDAHFVCLDTHSSAYWVDAAGRAKQLQWAKADLAASSARWKFVFFHKPPYSGGTHGDATDVIQNIVPLAEDAGVDVVFAGHSHVYERTYLLQNSAILQNDPASYTKFSGANGTLYVVSGTAGQSGALTVNPNHPLMAFQKGNTLGNSVIDVSGPVVHGYFLEGDGGTDDLFTLYKDVDNQGPRVIGVRAGQANTQVQIAFDEPVAAASAQSASAYAISPAVAVSGAALGPDGRTVTITTAPHAPGDYAMAISGVLDRASPPNAVQAGTQVLYSFSAPPDGGAPDAGTPDAGAPDAGTSADAGAQLLLADWGGSWRYALGQADPPAAWTSSSFDDSSWAGGMAPLGYGETRIRTALPMADAGVLTFYARAQAPLAAAPAALDSLWLDIDYDDGFVAYLDGVEVARRGVAAGQTHASAAASHESGTPERIDLTPWIPALARGANALAVELHNVSLTSSDALLDARLGAAVKPLPPYASDAFPAPGATGVDPHSEIRARVRDDTLGVDGAKVELWVDGLRSDPVLTGGLGDWQLSFTPPAALPLGREIPVEVRATNRQGIAMAPFTWSFTVATESSPPGDPTPSCGCTSAAAGPLLGIAALALLLRRRRARAR